MGAKRDWVRIGSPGDFREGKGRVVKVDGVKVAVFRIGATLHAIKDACPHMGASLGDGKLEGRRVICHMHGWTFDLANGVCSQTRQKEATIYDVKTEGGVVYAKPSPPPASPSTSSSDDDGWVVFDPDKHLKKRKD